VPDDPKQTEETISIDAAGNSVSVRMHGSETVSMDIDGQAAAEYQWDGRIRQGTWKQNIDAEYTGASDYDGTIETGWAEVRLRCSTGTGGNGDEATITLSAGGG